MGDIPTATTVSTNIISIDEQELIKYVSKETVKLAKDKNEFEKEELKKMMEFEKKLKQEQHDSELKRLKVLEKKDLELIERKWMEEQEREYAQWSVENPNAAAERYRQEREEQENKRNMERLSREHQFTLDVKLKEKDLEMEQEKAKIYLSTKHLRDDERKWFIQSIGTVFIFSGLGCFVFSSL